MATYGIEEEVFVTEPEKPTLKSLYYLAKLLWKNPRFSYIHTASNFSRGKDIKAGLMSGIEVATGVHSSIDDLLDDLLDWRYRLAQVTEGLIVPMGSLINYNTPTNCSAFQVHVGEVKNQDLVYRNLVHFLPILSILTMNAPYVDGRYFGKSFRMAFSYAIGPLRSSRVYRFQDIIIAKRLGTIELRVFDPTWDTKRIRTLLGAIDVIVNLNKDISSNSDIAFYNDLRSKIVEDGFIDELRPLHQELSAYFNVPEELLLYTASDQVRDYYKQNGLLNTYSALDNGYRYGVFASGEIPQPKAEKIKATLGFMGYYVPKLPYVVWKYIKDS